MTVDELLEVVDAKRGRSGLLNDSEGSVNDGLVDDLELQERLDDVMHCDDAHTRLIRIRVGVLHELEHKRQMRRAVTEELEYGAQCVACVAEGYFMFAKLH